MDHEYKIQIYDKNGLTSLYINDFISFNIKAVLNNSGYWKLKSRSKDDCPIPKGGGIVVYRDDKFIYSGILQKIVSNYDVISKEWIWEATGTGDIDWLKYRVIFPDPHTRYHETSSFDEDKRYFKYFAEFGVLSLAYNLIYYNLSTGVKENERGGKINFAFVNYSWDDDVPVPVNYYLRYNNLFDIVSELLTIGNGKIIPVWEKEELIFHIRNKKDISDFVYIQTESDQVKSLTHTVQSPDCSRLIASSNSKMIWHYDTSEEGYYDLPVVKDEGVGYPWARWEEEMVSESASEWGVREKAVDLKVEDFETPDDLVYDYDFTFQNLEKLTIGEAKKKAEKLEGYKIELTNHPSVPQFKTHYDLGDTIGVIFPDGTKMITEIVGVQIYIAYGEERIIPETGAIVRGFNHSNKMNIKELQNQHEDKKQEEETLDARRQ